MDKTKVYADNSTSRSADGSGSEINTEAATRGTPEQGADMFKRQQKQLEEQKKTSRERALKIDPDNYTPSRD
tara:strand:- start:275 stop:490 length:216 start_codon:yes stop_codon:yes gene_type:complete